MTYTAHRDYRFEYAGDVIEFIESMQCKGCAFRESDPDMPMCVDIATSIILEEPVECLDDVGDDGVVCTKYKSEELAQQEHEDQLRLFTLE